MKKNIDVGCLLYIIAFIVCYVISNVVACRDIEFFGISATASIFIYPFLYLILTLFKERYGKEKTVLLLNISVIALLFATLLITIASLFPVHNNFDGLEPLFNNNIRFVFAALIGFYFSQNLHLMIYDYLRYSKFINFLLSAVIAVTADQIVFVLVAYIKKGITLNALASKFTGQYTFNVIAIIIYSIIFGIILYFKSKKEQELKLLKEQEKLAKKKKKTNK